MLTTLIRDIGSFFFQTKKQLSSNNVMNRKYIINPNEIVFMCFYKCPLVLCYAFKLCKHYNLFQSFFHTILYRFTVQNLVMSKFTYSCHLVFPCKSWLCIWLVNWNLKEFFLVLLLLIDWKTCLFFLNLVSLTTFRWFGGSLISIKFTEHLGDKASHFIEIVVYTRLTNWVPRTPENASYPYETCSAVQRHKIASK